MCLFSASPAVTGPYCCAAGSLNHKAPAQEAFHLRLLEVCQQVLREVRSPGGPRAPRAPHLTVFQRPRVPEICNRLVLCNVLVHCTILLDKAPPFWWQVKTELGIPPKKSHEDPSPGLSPGSLHVLSLHKPVWFMTSRMLQQVSLQIVSRWAWCLVGNVWTHLKQKQSRKLFVKVVAEESMCAQREVQRFSNPSHYNLNVTHWGLNKNILFPGTCLFSWTRK